MVPVLTESNLSTAKKVIDSLYLWLVVSSILLGLSVSMIDSLAKGVVVFTSISESLLNVLLALFGIVGLLISALLLYNILRIMWGHALLSYPYTRLHKLNDEEIVRLIKDVITLYRGYRWYIALAGAMLSVTGVVLMAITIKESINVELWSSLFRFAVAIIYLGYGILDIYLDRKTIFKKLAITKQLEPELSKFIE